MILLNNIIGCADVIICIVNAIILKRILANTNEETKREFLLYVAICFSISIATLVIWLLF